MALLTERQTMLAQALESSRQRRAEALANQVAEKRSLLEHAGLMAFAHELLKENDPSSFVHAARITHNRWDGLQLSADNTDVCSQNPKTLDCYLSFWQIGSVY